MAMLKSITGHDNASAYIQEYLELGSEKNTDRALAKDYLNLPRKKSKENWARAMDRKRKLWSLHYNKGVFA